MSSASMNTENEASMEHAYVTERPERDAKFFARMGWILAIVGAGSFFTWAALAPLDQGIPVQGTVVVSGKRKAVQSMSAGVVSRILVREGEIVKQGSHCSASTRPRSRPTCSRCKPSTAWPGPASRAGRPSAITSSR